jgi:NAD(P)-dependent dehydrogenase (short-subunit alcohol dehydrogenase family)
MERHDPPRFPVGISVHPRRGEADDAPRSRRNRLHVLRCTKTHAMDGTPRRRASFSVAKAGIHRFVRDAAMTLPEHGIMIDAVALRPIETERTEKTFEDLRETGACSPQVLVPVRRMGQLHEIVDVVLVLVSEEPSCAIGHDVDYCRWAMTTRNPLPLKVGIAQGILGARGNRC